MSVDNELLKIIGTYHFECLVWCASPWVKDCVWVTGEDPEELRQE